MKLWIVRFIFLILIITATLWSIHKISAEYSGNADIDFGGNSVIGRYHYGKYDRTVTNITQWQYDIMNDLGIPFKTMLYLRTIQSLECGDENGFCINNYDCGPFQVNQIHPVEHKWCRNMVQKGKKEIDSAKKTGDWSKVLEIRNELYKSQILWTWGRMKYQVKHFELSDNREKRMFSLAKLHNGSKHKIDYANKAVISYKILRDYYLNLGLK